MKTLWQWVREICAGEPRPRRQPRRAQPFRPGLEQLERREVLSTAAPQAWLMNYDWHGLGRVAMQVTGDQGQWQSNTYTDPGTGPDHHSATGAWSWMAGGEADPVAFIGNRTPNLKAGFSLDYPGVKTLQVKAVASDGSLLFVSKQISTTQSWVNVTLTGQDTVGNAIDNREVTLTWYERVNGGDWQLTPDVSQTSQRLFVTYAAALSPGVNHTTAKRMDYATHWAQGIDRSQIMDIADAIDKDAMAHFYNRTGVSVWTGEAAWQVIPNIPNGGGMCADDSWLMKDALGEIGIWSQVRYVYPRTYAWAGLVGYAPGENTYRQGAPANTNAWLGYVGAHGEWNNYEACCFVHTSTTRRYYLGGNGAAADASARYQQSAFGVLNYVTQGGTMQTWLDQYNAHAPINAPWPHGTPPTY